MMNFRSVVTYISALVLMFATPITGAIQPIPGGMWIPAPAWNGVTTAPAFSAGVIDATTDRHAYVFRASRNCNLDQILFNVGDITTNAALEARVETVSATTPNPTGTLWAANTTGNVATPVANSANIATLTAAATLARGNIAAIVIQANTGPVSLEINRLIGISLANGATGLPYGTYNTSGSYSASTNPMVVGVRCSDGQWMYIGESAIPIETLVTSTFNTGTSATTGTRRGMRISMPVPFRINAIAFKGNITNGADYSVRLYNSAGVEIAVLATMDGNHAVTTAVNHYQIIFDEEQDLDAATEYYVAVVAATGTNISMYHYTVDDAAHLGAVPGGTDFYLVEFVNGAWVEVPTARPWMTIQVSGVDDGVDSGGGGETLGGRMIGGL